MYQKTRLMAIEHLMQADLSGIKGILWDLDNTLYIYEPVHTIALQACIQRAKEKYNIDEVEFTSSWNKARKSVHHDLHGKAASHSRLLYAQRTYEIIFGKSNAEFTVDIENTYWETFLSAMEWREGMQEFLQKAKDLQIRMCIVTDLTASIQWRKWMQLGLDRYMDFMVSSEEAGIEKPAARMFELAMQKLQLNADTLLMIGDSFEKDIQGAKALGIKTIEIQ